MSTPLWLVALVRKAFPARFLVARASHIPFVGKLLDRWLFESDHMFYLPHDRVIQVGQPLQHPEDVVLPSQVVEYFVIRAGYHWMMNACICRQSAGCQHYPIDLGCLFLGSAARGIHPDLGRCVTKEEALTHARRCRDAGLVHLIGRNTLDTVWLGIGPGDRLLTICNCCPCCCLWRTLPHFAPYISDKVARMPGVQVTVSQRCVGCGVCAQGVCFVDAIRVVDGRATIGQSCRGCGRCVSICPHQAIDLSIQHSESVDQAIGRIAPLVNLDA